MLALWKGDVDNFQNQNALFSGRFDRFLAVKIISGISGLFSFVFLAHKAGKWA